MKSSTDKKLEKSEKTKDASSPEQKQTAPAWQAVFSKRLPHRIGEPLSSSGGGDGCGG